MVIYIVGYNINMHKPHMHPVTGMTVSFLMITHNVGIHSFNKHFPEVWKYVP